MYALKVEAEGTTNPTAPGCFDRHFTNPALAHSVPSASKKNTLTEIIATELQIWQQIEEADGEISEEIEKALELVQMDRADKLDACKFILDQFALREEFLKKKEMEFRDTRKKCELLQERLKSRIKEGMTALGVSDATGNVYRFKLSVSKEPKITIDESILPVYYNKIVEEYRPDREKIRQDLELGLEIQGAKFEPVLTLRSYVNPEITPKLPKKAVNS